MRLSEIDLHPPKVLSRADRLSYYDQGYLVFSGLVGEDWLQPLREALVQVVEQTRTLKKSTRRIDIEANHSFENPRLRRVAYLDEFDQVFWKLCTDSVI